MRGGAFFKVEREKNTMAPQMKQLIQKLDAIQADIQYIKDHMIDADTVLTPPEARRLEEALDDLKAGRTTSLQDFEKEMRHAHR